MALTKVPSNLDATVATTQSASDNSTNVATTAYVTTALSNLVDSSPSALNTLNELAAALNDDASFSTTVNNSIATKLPLAGGTMTGNLAIGKEDPNITLTDSSASRTLAMFVDNNNSVVRASGNLLLQVGSASAITIDTNLRVFIGDATGANTSALNVTGQNGEQAIVAQVENNAYSLFQGFNASDALVTQFTGAGVFTHNGSFDINGSGDISGAITTGAISIPSQGIKLNQDFGTGVPTMTMLGTAANGRAGAIHFTEQGDVSTAAIYSTDGAGGNSSYGGLTIATYQSDLRFATNGLASTRMTIDASGNVGIGITPQSFAKLQVKATTDQNVSVFTNSAGLTIGGITDAGGSAALRIAGAPLHFSGGGGGASAGPHLVIDNNGNVGIGVSNNGQTRVDVLASGSANHSIQVRGTSNGSDDTTLTKGIRAVSANANNWAGLQMSASYLRFSHQDSSSDFEVHPSGVYIGDNGAQGTFAYNVVAGWANGGSASSYSSSYSAAQTLSTQSISVDSFKTVGMINTRAYASYINIKTNITANNQMFLAHFLGYNYNYGNKEFYSGGYTYSSNSILAKNDITTFGGNSSTVDSYRASDGALCFKLYMNHTGYSEGYTIFRFHCHSPAVTRQCTIAAVQIRNDGTNHFA